MNITFLAEVIAGEMLSEPLDPTIEAVQLVPVSELAGVDLRPPLGTAIQDAFRTGFCASAVYLGAMWTPEGGPE